MIWEPDIVEKNDIVGCRPPCGGGWYWQIQRKRFAPLFEQAFVSAETRATIDRQKLLEFSWHRGPCTVMGVPLDSKTLQSFVEYFASGELDVRVGLADDDQDSGLLVRQGDVTGILHKMTFIEADVEASFELKYANREVKTQTRYREDISDATNSENYAVWVDACANGPEKVPRALDFKNAAKIHAFRPIFGAPVPTVWFDGEGNGPSSIEVQIGGLDVVRRDGTRDISRRADISIPGTSLTGAGGFSIGAIDELIANLTKARDWMLDGMVVEGCECGICGKHTPDEMRCVPARATQTAPSEPTSDECNQFG